MGVESCFGGYYPEFRVSEDVEQYNVILVDVNESYMYIFVCFQI